MRCLHDFFLAEAPSVEAGPRLIRQQRPGDRGLLVITNPRLRQMVDGRRLRQALPAMGALDSEGDAPAWAGRTGPQP